jgi:hypothetical protein
LAGQHQIVRPPRPPVGRGEYDGMAEPSQHAPTPSDRIPARDGNEDVGHLDLAARAVRRGLAGALLLRHMRGGEADDSMRSRTMSKRIAARRPAGRGPASAKTTLGALPERNLADLYSGLDDPAVRRDLDRADAECVAFEQAYKGKCCPVSRKTVKL